VRAALRLVNPDLKENIYDLIEATELDPEQGELERELSRQYHILTTQFSVAPSAGLAITRICQGLSTFVF
jgi:hypothetical protein